MKNNEGKKFLFYLDLNLENRGSKKKKRKKNESDKKKGGQIKSSKPPLQSRDCLNQLQIDIPGRENEAGSCSVA